jgi:error-prone DNA polymerase
VTSDVAKKVFAQLEAFGGYSFAKSHAASFAVIVYQSAWLKRYHPATFLSSLLNQQPMGYWTPAVLLGDARRHRITIMPVDIDRSQAKCVLEGNDVRGGLKNVVRLGFNLVDGFGEVSLARLVETRRHGSFRNLAGLCRCTRLPRRLVEHLILAGALDRWNIPRRRLLWELGTLSYQEEKLDLDVPADDVELPELSRSEEVTWEHTVLGLSTGDHVLAFYRDQLTAQGILDSMALKQQPDGEQVKVAGLVVVHQSPPTAKGFHFLTLEDEVGLIDVIVRPQVYTRTRRIWRTASLLLVAGTVQRGEGVVNLLAQQVAAWSHFGEDQGN